MAWPLIRMFGPRAISADISSILFAVNTYLRSRCLYSLLMFSMKKISLPLLGERSAVMCQYVNWVSSDLRTDHGNAFQQIHVIIEKQIEIMCQQWIYAWYAEIYYIDVYQWAQDWRRLPKLIARYDPSSSLQSQMERIERYLLFLRFPYPQLTPVSLSPQSCLLLFVVYVFSSWKKKSPALLPWIFCCHVWLTHILYLWIKNYGHLNESLG